MDKSNKLKTTAHLFELPQKLGIVQEVIYEKPSHDKCPDGERCPYEGVLVAEGCRKGVCVRYRVRVVSPDRRNWLVEGFRRERIEWGGCVPQPVADALWELSAKYDIGIWYEYRYLSPCIGCNAVLYRRECGVVVNGVRITMPYCRSVSDCIEQILYYKREVEKLKEPPEIHLHNPAEELLQKYPELEAFGVDWVKKWAPHAKDRLIEVAKILRKYSWMVEAVKRRTVSNPHPYTIEVYMSADGSEVCISLAPSKAYCMRNGAVKAVPLDVSCEYKEGKMVCRPKGLLAFAAASEYVKIL